MSFVLRVAVEGWVHVPRFRVLLLKNALRQTTGDIEWSALNAPDVRRGFGAGVEAGVIHEFQIIVSS